jgi:iron complex outermembrane receptor protein
VAVPAGGHSAQFQHAGRPRARRPQPDRAVADLAAQCGHLAHAAGLWQKDKSGSTSQFFPWEGTLLPNPNGQLPTSRFIGEPGDYYDSERKSIGWLFEHKFNDTWTVRQNFRTSSNENDNRYHYGDFFTSPGSWGSDPVAKRRLGRINDSSLTRNRITALDNHAEGHFTTGALKHTLLVGADFARHSENTWSGMTFSDIDAYAPVYGNLLLPERSALPGTTQRQTGFICKTR